MTFRLTEVKCHELCVLLAFICPAWSWQNVAHGPNWTSFLFFNLVMFVCLHIIYDCFHGTRAELHSCDREHIRPSKPKIFTFLYRKICRADVWSHIIKHFILESLAKLCISLYSFSSQFNFRFLTYWYRLYIKCHHISQGSGNWRENLIKGNNRTNL